ncbi:MAG: Hsp20/alpha crystallin family protein [Kiritimatiellales bacterium]|nr:Hsp20/alpha crystallin family protein [Kiritimatiellales bacterium]
MKEKNEKSLAKYGEGDAELTREGPVFVPVADIYEKDDAILVRCDMPGVEEGQIDITLENNELAITGNQAGFRPEGYDRLSSEYETGVFRRVFKIPQLIDREKIMARLRNGVLDIELPKAEQAKPRKIAIATGS